ncbi:hypothetical protein Cgig2_033575 [Carnegiea gigantea]|uniref:Uncharacterized protein n=1 Tax=Carnegiea gigantea TaxID=171969 RepID=A0A9Q1KQI0_9CARY|nr:hypothetical protein Cgig2_033575 [Carnegiea gigantea]
MQNMHMSHAYSLYAKKNCPAIHHHDDFIIVIIVGGVMKLLKIIRGTCDEKQGAHDPNYKSQKPPRYRRNLAANHHRPEQTRRAMKQCWVDIYRNSIEELASNFTGSSLPWVLKKTECTRAHLGVQLRPNFIKKDAEKEAEERKILEIVQATFYAIMTAHAEELGMLPVIVADREHAGAPRPPYPLPEDYHQLCPDFDPTEVEQVAWVFEVPEIVKFIFYSMVVNDILEQGVVMSYCNYY